MRQHVARGGLCYEPFSGSGSQIMAGEANGRRVFAMEISPAYVDVAVERWQAETGRNAILDGDGRSFEATGTRGPRAARRLLPRRHDPRVDGYGDGQDLRARPDICAPRAGPHRGSAGLPRVRRDGDEPRGGGARDRRSHRRRDGCPGSPDASGARSSCDHGATVVSASTQIATIDPDRIVAVARSWLGTPYHDQASLKGVGCDCLGLARGVWREVVGPEPFPIPPYSRDWGESGPVEVLAAGARRMMPEVDPLTAGAGTLLLFRMMPRAIAKHVGILTAPARFIHAYERIGVVEQDLNPAWRRRIAFVFLFPRVEA